MLAHSDNGLWAVSDGMGGHAAGDVASALVVDALKAVAAGGDAHRLMQAAQTALAAEKLNLAGGLWIITERAVATEPGEPVDPAQAALWGLGRTIIAEQPTLRCRLEIGRAHV